MMDTSQEQDSITKHVTDPQVVRGAAFLEVYANYVSFAASAWDMTIMFGRTVTDDPANPCIEQRASVSLSPQTAKALAHILLRNLENYEQLYGEIRLIPIQRQPEED